MGRSFISPLLQKHLLSLTLWFIFSLPIHLSALCFSYSFYIRTLHSSLCPPPHLFTFHHTASPKSERLDPGSLKNVHYYALSSSKLHSLVWCLYFNQNINNVYVICSLRSTLFTMFTVMKNLVCYCINTKCFYSKTKGY